MLFSDVRKVVGEFARGSVRIDDEGVSLGGVDRVVDGVGCSLTTTLNCGNHIFQRALYTPPPIPHRLRTDS